MQAGKKVATGEFGADMKIALLNDGPVTIFIDTQTRNRMEEITLRKARKW